MSIFDESARFDDWDKVAELTPLQAGFLWFNLEPRTWPAPIPDRVLAMAFEVAEATNSRVWDHKPEFAGAARPPQDGRKERVTRQALISFAEGKGQRPAFLFPSERSKRRETPGPMPTDASRFSATEDSQHEAARHVARLSQQVEALTSERDTLEKKVRLMDPLAPKERDNLFRIIAALCEVVLGEVPGMKDHARFKNQAQLIEFLADKYRGISGLSKRNLESVLPAAKRCIGES
jgi:hypothetical protein